MNCLACARAFEAFFSKDFAGECGLSRVDYVRCVECGLAVSQTHLSMPADAWQAVNSGYHSTYQGTEDSPDDPRWLARLASQADVLAQLRGAGILPEGPWLDYGCGDGKLADLLAERGLPTLKYDRYMGGEGYVGEDALAHRYGVIINTSVLEHVRAREELDAVVDLVGEDGVMAFHTLVAEAVPKDPTWFYLLPVHTVFFSNRSMQVLFEQWGFEASIYHLPSQMWFAFRKDRPALRAFVDAERARGNEAIHYQQGFLDYWKCRPYRAES